jgi:hypothetical protein
MRLFESILTGIGATLCIDLWALLLRTALDVRSLDYCLLGRWVLHMPEGRFTHPSIASSPARPHECTIGWIAHYSIGVAFAMLFIGVMGAGWQSRPTLLPALVFGVITVAVPWFTMQPAFGLGIAASRTPNPAASRVKSLMTHTIFGAGLFLAAHLLNAVS